MIFIYLHLVEHSRMMLMLIIVLVLQYLMFCSLLKMKFKPKEVITGERAIYFFHDLKLLLVNLN